ncbi:MAG: hypothetical protein JEZ07_05645 [Phycisphaerae bacterium]|nr:hypothetical protein [Phycisphaerae bacterium]
MLKKIKGYKRVLVFVGIVFAMMVVGLLVYKAVTRQMLNNRIEHYRDLGYPMSIEEANEYFYKNVKDLPNKADMVREAIAAIDIWNSSNNIGRLDIVPVVGSATLDRRQWMTQEQLERSIEFLDDNKQTLDILYELLNDPRQCYMLTEVWVNLGVPEYLSDMRTLVKLLWLKAKVDIQQGRIDEGILGIKKVFELASLLDNDRLMICKLVSMSIQAIAIEMAAECLNLCQLNPEQLNDLIVIFADARINMSSPKDTYILERAILADAAINDNLKQDYLYNTKEWEWRAYHALADDNDLVQSFDMNQVFIDCADDLDWKKMHRALSMPDMAKRYNGYERFINQLSTLQAKLDSGLFWIHGKLIMQMTMVQMAAKMELYCLDKGRFPDTLELLTPGYISEIPVDLFSGAELKYVKLDDGYMLYSVGYDMTDDGGNEEDDIVFVVQRQLN